MTEGSVLGAVLAGGGSRRFGSPKALAPFLGEPMALRAVRALEGVCREVVIVTSVPEVAQALETPPHSLRVLPDRAPGAGPLAGLQAALEEAGRAGDVAVLLLGCDMPLVTAELVSLVAEEGRGRGRPVALPAPDPNGLEPLCAWYSLDCLPLVAGRLEGNDRSMMGLVQELDPHRIPEKRLSRVAHPELALRSVNTPGELERLESFLLER